MILNPTSSQALSLRLHLTMPKGLENMKDVDQSVPLAFAQAPAVGEPIALSLRLLSLLCQSL